MAVDPANSTARQLGKGLNGPAGGDRTAVISRQLGAADQNENIRVSSALLVWLLHSGDLAPSSLVQCYRQWQQGSAWSMLRRLAMACCCCCFLFFLSHEITRLRIFFITIWNLKIRISNLLFGKNKSEEKIPMQKPYGSEKPNLKRKKTAIKIWKFMFQRTLEIRKTFGWKLRSAKHRRRSTRSDLGQSKI